MPVFRNAPVGAVSRAFGISAVRGSAPSQGSGPRRPGNRFPVAGAAPARTGPAKPPPPATGTAIGAASDADYPLAGLLRCAACQLPLRPVEMLGGRAYGAPCGCRLTVVAADLLERLVYDAVLAHPDARDADCGGAGDGVDSAAADGGGAADLSDGRREALFRRYLAEVRIGGDPDDLSFVWIV